MVQSNGRLSHSPDTTLISLATPLFVKVSQDYISVCSHGYALLLDDQREL